MISYALARLRPSNTHVLRRLSQFRAVANLLQPTNDAEADYAEARKWAAELGRDSIPKHLGHVRYDRSSGKGGQHVNTTSSKATSTWPLDSVLPLIPKILHPYLRSSRYYVASSDSLQIASQASRSAHQNEEDCHEKMIEHLQEIVRQAIPGETTPEQKAKVKKLKNAENTARLNIKKHHSAKKQSRGSGGRYDY